MILKKYAKYRTKAKNYIEPDKEVFSRFISLCKQNEKQVNEYCEKRGWAWETVKDLDIGYCDVFVYEELIKEFGKERLKKFGFFVNSNRQYRFVNRIIFGYQDYCYFSARMLDRTTDKRYCLFPTGVQKQYYKIGNPEAGRVIVCEGETDSIALLHIYPDALVIGLGGARSNVAKYLASEFSDKEIVVCFDNDKTGQEATEDLIKQLQKSGISPSVLIFPEEYKDIDKLYKEHRQEAEDYIKIEIRLDKFSKILEKIEGLEKLNAKEQPAKVNVILEEDVVGLDITYTEMCLKKIKKATGLSISGLRKKLLKLKTQTKTLQTEYPKELDKRFKCPKLLQHINTELSIRHKSDEYQKIGTFIICASAYLPDPRDHVSVAIKGQSSAGKDHLIKELLNHLPKETWAFVTRITRSELEDNIHKWKILALSEINKKREGANADITETYKQVIEGGARIFKKDNITGESKEIDVEQKTGLFGTTETVTDQELATRYLVVGIMGDRLKNKIVVDDQLNKVGNEDYYLNKFAKEESWIAKSIRALDYQAQPILPFAKMLVNQIKIGDEFKYLFNYNKERVKRDVKRLLSLTKAITWLYQAQRDTYQKHGQTFIQADVIDFINALKIFQRFLNLSYEGIDPRLQKVRDWIKEQQGKHSKEITKDGYPVKYVDWVPRHKAQKHFDVTRQTITAWVKQLKNRNLIKTLWDPQITRKNYLLKVPVNSPVNDLIAPVNLKSIYGSLTIGFTGQKQDLDNVFEPKQPKNPFIYKEKVFFLTDRSKFTGHQFTSKFTQISPEKKIFYLNKILEKRKKNKNLTKSLFFGVFDELAESQERGLVEIVGLVDSLQKKGYNKEEIELTIKHYKKREPEIFEPKSGFLRRLK